MNAGKEGTVYVYLELDEQGALRNYRVGKDQSLVACDFLQEIVVISLASKPTHASPDSNTVIQSSLNAEVEQALKKYIPKTKVNKSAITPLCFKIDFRIEN